MSAEIKYKSSGFMDLLMPRVREARHTLVLLNRNALTRLAFMGAVLLLLIGVFAPFVIPYPQDISDATHSEIKLEAPSSSHFFGTDELGRDIFSRVLYGTRISLTTAVFAVGLALLIGVPLGAIAGTFGGWIDEIIMRVTDIFLSFPPLLLAIAIVALAGPSLQNAILAISLSWWPWYTRLVRGQTISLKERKFVQAAEAIGTNSWRIVFGHIVPNTISPVIVQASMDMGGVILTIASLSFLGLGAQAPTPEWGLMISTSRNYFLDSWWYSFYPGISIFVTVLIFNLLGDGLREILDPKTRKR